MNSVVSAPIPLIVGVNHRSGSLSLRDRLFVEDDDVPNFLNGLRAAGLDQALILSTCDRVEVAATALPESTVSAIVTDAMVRHSGLSSDELSPSIYAKSGPDAIGHLFRVASSLDSVVLGEPQVLGQVKACHKMARDNGMVSGELERLLQAAYATAKRVRTETAVGERPVSIAAVAVSIARDLFGDLDGATGLVVGNGEMGELIARELQKGGMRSMGVIDAAGRTARHVADVLNVRHATEDEMGAELAGADVILTAVGGRQPTLTADMVRAAIRARRRKPQFIVDASLPSDVEPAVDRLDDAFLFDMGDLERLAAEGRSSREAEASDAERIVTDEVARFLNAGRAREAAPLITQLRGHVAHLREEALQEAGGDAERATHLLVQKLLHGPSEYLRIQATLGEGLDDIEKVIRDMYGLAARDEEKK